jgi:hypothetical protein
MYLREVERGEATVSCRRGGARDEVLLVLMDVGRVQEGRFEKEGKLSACSGLSPALSHDSRTA